MQQQIADERVAEKSVEIDQMDDETHLGRVFAVPDKWWGFEAVGREDHPGACVQELPATREWILLKGTGAEDRTKYHATESVIAPTAENGLFKLTVFSLRPRPFRNKKLANLIQERVMGMLCADELQQLRSGMIRQFGLRG